MTMAAHPALVLNADFRPMSYFPLSLLRWEDAVHAVFNDRVSIVAEYDTWVRSPSTKIRLPSVVALRKYQPAARRVAFTRFNVFLRDRFTCQYCGEAFASSALTFEHVIPRSRGGQTSWSNIVTACMPCNTGKGNSMRIKRGARQGSRRPASCWLPSAHSHLTICTRAGWTISVGMWSWKPNAVS